MPPFFVQESVPLLEIDIEEYIKEYKPYIQYITKKRANWLDSHSLEDMESFIVVELIQLYPKKYKYTDFDWVTRTVIRRKAIDFTTNFIKKNEDIVFENECPADDSTGGERNVINSFFLEKSISNHKDKSKSEEIVLLVKDIDFKINNTHRQFFSDWCRELIEVVLELHESGYDCNREDVLACMGYDANEVIKFNSKLLSFRNKLKTYLGLDAEAVFGVVDQKEQQ